MITLAQETTTLAEGATVSVLRRSNPKSGLVGTYLVAAREKAELKMRVDDVAPGSLRTYLDLMVRWIQRERSKITAKPEVMIGTPDNLKDFVHNMAHQGMFVFEVLSDANTNRNTTIPRTGRKVSRHKGRTGDQSHTG